MGWIAAVKTELLPTPLLNRFTYSLSLSNCTESLVPSPTARSTNLRFVERYNVSPPSPSQQSLSCFCPFESGREFIEIGHLTAWKTKEFVIESTFQQLERLSSRAEFVALLDLRSSLGLRSKEWPIKGDPCAAWKGITCQNGRVIEINISGFRRTRIGKRNPQFAVGSLANLTLLQSFNASNFLLPGVIPDWFGNVLSSLQLLDLRSCSVVGSIPFTLGNLDNLTRLYLSNNNLTGSVPFNLSQLMRLSILDLSHNSLNGSISLSFSSLGNLTLLDLSSNFLSGSISPAIGTLSKLQYLNLSRNLFSSSLPSRLGELDSLIDLDLSFNSFSGSLPQDFEGLRSLQRLELQSNLLIGLLPDNLFSSLTQLQSLVLRNNNFTGSVPNELWSMPRLLLLDISGNNFSGIAPNSSSNATDSAGLLNISNNDFYGVLSPVFRRFSVIDLSGNYFEGKVPEYLLPNASLGNNCLQNVSKQRTQVECSSFYAQKGLTFDNFGLQNSTQPASPGTPSKNKRLAIILGSAIGGLALIILLVLLLLIFLYRRRRGSTAHDQREVGVRPVSHGVSEKPHAVSINFSSLGDAFLFKQLLEATSGFSDSNLIKRGHSGDLFRGILENGNPVIIKRVDLKSMKKEAYLSELDFFSKISHPRFVPLLGHCLENENEKFLVYKYMPNGDLSSSLFRKPTAEDDKLKSLDWIIRLKIALGAAEGLSFLHHECNPPLVHRDIQASSILLDDKFEVRLGSLSEVCAQEGDSHQNRITKLLRLPQSSEQGSLGSQTTTCSYDVYCFGKVLLELVTGKLGISACSEGQFKEHLDETLPHISIHEKDAVTKIIDSSLIVDEDLLEEVWAMAVVAKSCLNPKPSRRPLMKYIVKALENPLKVVREESSNSGKLKTSTSSGSLWTATIFGSWRHSLSDQTLVRGASAGRGGGSFKQSGTTGSQGSGQNGKSDHSSSRRRQSKEICPEPVQVEEVE